MTTNTETAEISVLHVRTTGDVCWTRIHPNSLEQVQALVEGYIEHVPSGTGEGWTVIVNGEGHLAGLEHNKSADHLFLQFGGHPQMLGDGFVGDVAFAGVADGALIEFPEHLLDQGVSA